MVTGVDLQGITSIATHTGQPPLQQIDLDFLDLDI